METKPLSQLTVVDLTVNTPGPFCSAVLSDFGARVIKVEPPRGDPLRETPGMWASLNRGKQSIVLDLKTTAGQELLGRLASTGDIVLEGWRPGVAKRLGADYPTLSARNPRLVYCSISGFGQEGPWRDRPGHDLNYLALGGYLAVQAVIEGRPWPPPIPVSDLAAGLYAAIAVLAAVSGRQASGQGAYVDLSLAEAATALLGPEVWGSGESDGSDALPNVTHIPTYGLFPCADGGWMSIGIVHEDHFWQRLCAVAGLDELAGLKFAQRLERAEEVREALREVLLSRSSKDWETALVKADVPGAAVVKLSEVFESPQFKARGLFADVDSQRYVAQPVRLSTGSIAPSKGPPLLDEHRGQIVAELKARGSGGQSQPEASSKAEGTVGV